MKWWHGLLAGVASGATVGLTASYITSRSIKAEVDEGLSNPPGYRVHGCLVSVVVPTLQEENYLPPLLQSIKNQTYSPVEIIVADSSTGNSREATKALCNKYCAKYLYVPKLNVALARNKGAEFANGEILMFADADCIMCREYIEKIVGALEERHVFAHGSDPCYGDVRYSTVSVITMKWFKPLLHTTGRGVAIWAESFWNIGGYDISCDPAGPEQCREDLEFGKRVADCYGRDSMVRVGDAVIVTWPRREQAFGWHKSWQTRGVRDGIID